MRGRCPSGKGYLITWLYSSKPTETAIEEAIQKTEEALDGKVAASSFIERVEPR